MKKIIILSIIIIAFALAWKMQNTSPHEPISINEVAKIELRGDIPSHVSRTATKAELEKIVLWFNSLTNITENKEFAGSTPSAGIRIILKNGRDISIINSGKDFEVQRTVNLKTVSYWAKQTEIKELLKELAHEEKLEIQIKKPIIYLYPTSEQRVSVKLDFHGYLKVTYPEYNNGWHIIAQPDGTLLNIKDSKEYSYLFWEGVSNFNDWNLSKGYVVKGEDTKKFLQETLSKMGLTPREYNDFIVYWLPQMVDNKYNLIHFAQKEYEELAPIHVYPKPDSILRVFMVFKPLDNYLEIDKQTINGFVRKGFTVVEWGGAELH
ncbi:hypothetical protein [Desulfotomaculum sp. 1211_IL3151]|uniref:hypothetical protein n=1 Tax=Desulfotomaculum sp. 1211_IL3151 TaxID=3084055 RepID=UPI002FD9D29A